MPKDQLSPIYALASDFVEQAAAADPVSATQEGIPAYDRQITDYSPAGIAERFDLTRKTLNQLDALSATNRRDATAARSMRWHFETETQLHEAGEQWRELRVIGSPVSSIRECFDVMPRNTREDWEIIADRMGQVPSGVASLQHTLREGMGKGILSARRQALECAEQARVWGGLAGSEKAFFAALANQYSEDDSLKRDLEAAASAATSAYADLAQFLTEEYAPVAPDKDGVGKERYQILSRAFTGMDINPEETYVWGWEQVQEIRDEMDQIGKQILPGGSRAEVIEFLESDPNRTIEGEGAFRDWLQALMDRTISEVNGKHFDIPQPIQRVEAMIAPPGGAAAMYYTGPSEDLSRPGRTWYPTLGRTTFPLWHEVTTCYHEGVPGHHLQVAMVRYLADELSRFQRSMGFISGHGEGWALYAELLMYELGYLDDPAWVFGMLQAQLFRAARVVLDIGMHLEMAIPSGAFFHPGEIWNAELAYQFMRELTGQREEFLRSEITRYLGWPGQAISYKVGERVFLDVREETKLKLGAAFDLKEFHRAVLDLGPMGLQQFREEVSELF